MKIPRIFSVSFFIALFFLLHSEIPEIPV